MRTGRAHRDGDAAPCGARERDCVGSARSASRIDRAGSDRAVARGQRDRAAVCGREGRRCGAAAGRDVACTDVSAREDGDVAPCRGVRTRPVRAGRRDRRAARERECWRTPVHRRDLERSASERDRAVQRDVAIGEQVERALACVGDRRGRVDRDVARRYRASASGLRVRRPADRTLDGDRAGAARAGRRVDDDVGGLRAV